MSIAAVGAVKNSRVYDGAAFAVADALANIVDEDGICWPSQAYIAAIARISVKTVQRGLDVLERDGVVRVLVRNPGRGRSNKYRLDVQRFMAASLAAQKARDGAMRRRGGNAEDAEVEAKAAGEAAFGRHRCVDSGKKKGVTGSRQPFGKGDSVSHLPAGKGDTESDQVEKNRTPCPAFQRNMDSVSRLQDTESRPSLDTESYNTSIHINNTDSQVTTSSGDGHRGGSAIVPGSTARPTAPRSLTASELQQLRERLGEAEVRSWIEPCTWDGHVLRAPHAFGRDKIAGEWSFQVRQVLGVHASFGVQARPVSACV